MRLENRATPKCFSVISGVLLNVLGPNSKNLDGGVVAWQSSRPVRIREITDGASNTAMVLEASGHNNVYWADGLQVFMHDGDSINAKRGNEWFSEHTSGAHGLMADGSVHFFGEEVERRVIGALCTRANGETLQAGEWP